MSFYEAMEKYYDDIFPLSQNNLLFLEKTFADNSKQVLDLACGTGNYALALATKGYRVMGIDLDKTMIELAQQKKIKALNNSSSENVSFLKGNMLHLSNILNHTYDGAFCIGNSLVHLESAFEIATAIAETAKVLRRNSVLIIQIVNYNNILKNNIQALPTLENKERGVSFERFYRYNPHEHKIHFTGKLNLPDSSTRTNTVPLYPLQKKELEKSLEEAGFRNMQFCGNFSGEAWSVESPALISIAKT